MKCNANNALLKLARKFVWLLQAKFKERLVSVALFGSVARGEAHAHSDIDLFIVMKRLPHGRLARSRLVESIENELERDLDALREKGIFTSFNILVKTEAEARRTRPIYLDLTEDCMYLYDRDVFLKNIIDRLKNKLRQLGARRERVGNVRYWDLKPDLKPGEVLEL